MAGTETHGYRVTTVTLYHQNPCQFRKVCIGYCPYADDWKDVHYASVLAAG